MRDVLEPLGWLIPRSTTPRPTIPDLVMLELVQHPLPPSPAGIAAYVPPPTEDLPPSKRISTPRNKRQLFFSGAVAGLAGIWLIAILCFVLVVVPFVRDRFGQGEILLAGQTPSTEPDQSIIKPIAILSASSSPLIDSSATALATGPSAANPSGYELTIMRGPGNESVIVMNQTGNVFPLELLRLGDDQGGINGTEWGVTNLETGSCVGVWKEKEKNERNMLPKGLNCQIVGNLLVRDKKDWFGDRLFGVFYKKEQVGSCDKDLRQCVVQILP